MGLLRPPAAGPQGSGRDLVLPLGADSAAGTMIPQSLLQTLSELAFGFFLFLLGFFFFEIASHYIAQASLELILMTGLNS